MPAIPGVRPFVSRRVARWLTALLWCSVPVWTFAQAGDLPYAATTPYAEGAAVQDVDWSDDIPAHIAFIDGAATLERDGRPEAAEESTPLLAGDRIRTSRGRVEVLFADGSALDVDEFTDVDLLDDSLLRLHGGRVALTIARGGSSVDYRVDGAGSTAVIRGAGEYRAGLSDGRAGEAELRVAVIRGAAELSSPFGRTLIRAGYEAAATANTAPSLPYTASAAAWGAFDRWVDDQYDYRVGTSRSAQYLPDDLRAYGGSFDRDGSWEYAQPYGYVWYPTVNINWRPYYEGRWSFFGSFGWMWVGGGNRWSWPTHHYGRWGQTSGRWFWIPDRRFGPAWVSWASAPGYVSWCPLGFDNRPVFGITNIGIFNSPARRAWTVVPTRAFASGFSVRTQAVTDRSLVLASNTRFAVRRGAPVRPLAAASDVHVLRSPTAPVRAATSRSLRTIDASPGGRQSQAPAIIRGGQREAISRDSGSIRAAQGAIDRADASRPGSREVAPRARSRADSPSSLGAPRYEPFGGNLGGRTSPVERGGAARTGTDSSGPRARSRIIEPSSGGGAASSPSADNSRTWPSRSRQPQIDPGGDRRQGVERSRVSPARPMPSEQMPVPDSSARRRGIGRSDPPQSSGSPRMMPSAPRSAPPARVERESRPARESAPARSEPSRGRERSSGNSESSNGGQSSGGGHARHR